MTGIGSRTWAASSIALALVFAAYFLPQVVSVLLLIFAGTVLGVVLGAVTDSVQRLLPAGRWSDRRVGLLGMMVAIVLVFTVAGMLVVPQVLEQGPVLINRLPEAWSSLREQLDNYRLLQPLARTLGEPASWFESGGVLARATGVLSGTFDILFNMFVIAFIGLFLAANPEHYREVVLYPLSAARRRHAHNLMVELGRELRLWVVGRLASMTTVGVTTGIGLWLLDVSLAFTLGLLAGVLSFVPYLGPVLALVPALLISLADPSVSPGAVLLLYGGVQIFETYLLTPLIQQRAIAIAPAILISVQLLGGVFGGLLGILLAAPLAVVSATVLRERFGSDEGQAA